MKRSTLTIMLLLILGSPLQAQRSGKSPPKPYWAGAMAEVHSRFTGRCGTFAHFGDSITITMAFWTPLLYSLKNAPPEMEQAWQIVKPYVREECWRKWKLNVAHTE